MVTDRETRQAAERWIAALSKEAQIRAEVFRQAVSGSQPSPSQLQEWWASVERVWREYSRQIAAGIVPNPPPADIANVIAGLSGYLKVGKLPDPIRDAIGEGQRAPGPSERRDIEIAVAYHRAATVGIVHRGSKVSIEDKTPTKTISRAYQIGASTVRKWKSKYEPAFLGENEVNAEVLIGMMQRAGARYRQAGRSQAAIHVRNKKRT